VKEGRIYQKMSSYDLRIHTKEKNVNYTLSATVRRQNIFLLDFLPEKQRKYLKNQVLLRVQHGTSKKFTEKLYEF